MLHYSHNTLYINKIAFTSDIVGTAEREPNIICFHTRTEDVKKGLQTPTEIRCSQRDQNIFLFYSLERLNLWVVVVARQLNGDGFLITAYRTDAIKEGEQVWLK